MKLCGINIVFVLFFYFLHRVDAQDEKECPPIPPELTMEKTGIRAVDECIDNQAKYVFKCVNGELVNLRNSSIESRIVGGTEVPRGKYPHMALLGYGKDSETAFYQCGGSIIDTQFVVTAAHCIYEKNYGEVTWVKVGIQSRSEPDTSSNLFGVAERFPHPLYNSLTMYHDIAIIKLDRKIVFNELIYPICWDWSSVTHDRATAAGWGVQGEDEPLSPTLLEVELERFPDDLCHELYPESDYLGRSYNESIQLCYGHQTQSKDTCPGDSGGPLQVPHERIAYMYKMIGVTSYGHVCGYPGQPGMYCRVQRYTSYMSNIVWGSATTQT